MKNCILIGVAGGSGSGKTTVANNLVNAFKAEDATLLEQDAYYRELTNMTLEEKAKVNFDHPDSIEFELLKKHIIDLKNGKSIERPIYDFTTHSRKEGSVKINPSKIIVVEGILIFAVPEIRELFDVKIFADELIAEADVICCLDFNALSRIDAMAKPVAASAGRKVLIDHHLNPEDFCRVTISHPEISSTSELIFRLICRMGNFEDITREGAECIYTGMMTDTGGFTYNSNSREIYFIISELLSKGIDKDEIYRKVFNTYSEDRLRLMGYILYDKMQVFPRFHAALIWLTKDEQSKFHYVKGDTEGFVNIPLQMKGVCFSVFLREDTEKNMIKVSLRSVGTFPCNKVASEFFNGGGHLNASGGEFYGTMDEAIELFKQALVKYEDLLNK